jgi:hypothetical protein
MGYDTYNAFEKDFDGASTIEQGRLMKKYGLVDAGYNVGGLNPLGQEYILMSKSQTFILDDFYALPERSEKGEMIADPKKFPHGMWVSGVFVIEHD